MQPTTTPFNPVTGELLPAYREAYLRGDLARASAQAVERYLQRDSTQPGTVTHWYALNTAEKATATSWAPQQERSPREQSPRLRRRVGVFMLGVAAFAGVGTATTMRADTTQPARHWLGSTLQLAKLPLRAAETHAARTAAEHGQLLSEQSQPLAETTALREGNSTEASGSYALHVPAMAVSLQ